MQNTSIKRLSHLGFTLAEVLITLGLIGVVAAMTIPTLIISSQKIQYMSGLQKAYSQFSQALQAMTQSEDCVVDLACTGAFALNKTSKDLGQELSKYLKLSKDCGMTPAGQGCLSPSVNSNFDGSGTPIALDTDTNFEKFITADGMSFAIINGATNCDTDLGGTLGYMAKTCGYLYVDINGPKEPNNLGRDVFMFFITNGKGAFLYPAGGADDKSVDAGLANFSKGWWDIGGSDNCSSVTSKDGAYCTGRVFEKGWTMDY